MSTGAPSARHAAARSFVWRWYSGPSAAPTASAGDEREVGLVEAVPVAAVNENVHGDGTGPSPRGRKNIEPFGVMPAERHVEAHRQLGADARALGAVPRDPVHRVLYLRAVVVLRVERLLVVVQEYAHAAAFPAREGGAMFKTPTGRSGAPSGRPSPRPGTTSSLPGACRGRSSPRGR